MKSSDTISEYSTSSTISAAMEQRIQNELTRVEQAHGVKVLYACESGSRGWGFASQDSDYNVRFIYAHPADWYLAVCPEKQRDVLESGIVSTPDGVLDCSGWDVRKALRLLQKFNGLCRNGLHHLLFIESKAPLLTVPFQPPHKDSRRSPYGITTGASATKALNASRQNRLPRYGCMPFGPCLPCCG